MGHHPHPLHTLSVFHFVSFFFLDILQTVNVARMLEKRGEGMRIQVKIILHLHCLEGRESWVKNVKLLAKSWSKLAIALLGFGYGIFHTHSASVIFNSHNSHVLYTYNCYCKNQMVDRNFRIVDLWWTLCRNHVSGLNFGIFIADISHKHTTGGGVLFSCQSSSISTYLTDWVSD